MYRQYTIRDRSPLFRPAELQPTNKTVGPPHPTAPGAGPPAAHHKDSNEVQPWGSYEELHPPFPPHYLRNRFSKLRSEQQLRRQQQKPTVPQETEELRQKFLFFHELYSLRESPVSATSHPADIETVRVLVRQKYVGPVLTQVVPRSQIKKAK
ncbi:hypothetical protein QR680_004577 [Steinernema hermaphroditum]|uniref:Uncharacterized protein n=1 Tax=Steinernema hermaphroditum TaxID=289476 RepID=A0AA39HQK7_9BILA|nr:hypothetical protein QR680_004577 [Steinernema hermaphroditum]